MPESVVILPKLYRRLDTFIYYLRLTSQHLHGFGETLFFLRGNQQTHVIGHQYIGVKITAVCVAGLLEFFEIELVSVSAQKISVQLLPRRTTCCGWPGITNRGKRAIFITPISRRLHSTTRFVKYQSSLTPLNYLIYKNREFLYPKTKPHLL